jgi:hypothetical protein
MPGHWKCLLYHLAVKYGFSISPAQITRVDFERVECPKCDEKFRPDANSDLRLRRTWMSRVVRFLHQASGDKRISRRGAKFCMPEQLLDHNQWGAIVQHVGSARMSQRVWIHRLQSVRLTHNQKHPPNGSNIDRLGLRGQFRKPRVTRA